MDTKSGERKKYIPQGGRGLQKKLKKQHGYKNVEKERYIKTTWIQNLGKERCTETAWIQNARKERYIYIPQGGRDLQKKVKKPHGYNMKGKER